MQAQFEVERFYYQEANLLDDRQFEDWVALQRRHALLHAHPSHPLEA